MTTGLIVAADDELLKMTATISEFEDLNIVINDPRKDSCEILAAIRGRSCL